MGEAGTGDTYFQLEAETGDSPKMQKPELWRVTIRLSGVAHVGAGRGRSTADARAAAAFDLLPHLRKADGEVVCEKRGSKRKVGAGMEESFKIKAKASAQVDQN